MTNDRVAPIRGVPVAAKPWEGALVRKPWEYPCTAAIVHRDTPDMLAAVVTLLREQSMAPYLLIVDTGSGPNSQAVLDELDAADDCEVHCLRAKAWRGSSAAVAAAMDLAFTLCQTDLLFATHTDVFPTRPDLVEHVVSQCDARTPVVGWQMSPREGWPAGTWDVTPSHAATAYHMPTMRTIGVLWNMLGATEELGMMPGQHRNHFPDAETRPGQILARAGITPRWHDGPDDGGRHWLCLGPEPNEPYATHWFNHIRTSGSVFVYYPGSLMAAIRGAQIDREIEAIPDRLEQWQKTNASADADDADDEANAATSESTASSADSTL